PPRSRRWSAGVRASPHSITRPPGPPGAGVWGSREQGPLVLEQGEGVAELDGGLPVEPLVRVPAGGQALEAGAGELLAEGDEAAAGALEARDPVGAAVGVLGLEEQRLAQTGEAVADHLGRLRARLDGAAGLGEAAQHQAHRRARAERDPLRPEGE